MNKHMSDFSSVDQLVELKSRKRHNHKHHDTESKRKNKKSNRTSRHKHKKRKTVPHETNSSVFSSVWLKISSIFIPNNAASAIEDKADDKTFTNYTDPVKPPVLDKLPEESKSRKDKKRSKRRDTSKKVPEMVLNENIATGSVKNNPPANEPVMTKPADTESTHSIGAESIATKSLRTEPTKPVATEPAVTQRTNRVATKPTASLSTSTAPITPHKTSDKPMASSPTEVVLNWKGTKLFKSIEKFTELHSPKSSPPIRLSYPLKTEITVDEVTHPKVTKIQEIQEEALPQETEIQRNGKKPSKDTVPAHIEVNHQAIEINQKSSRVPGNVSEDEVEEIESKETQSPTKRKRSKSRRHNNGNSILKNKMDHSKQKVINGDRGSGFTIRLYSSSDSDSDVPLACTKNSKKAFLELSSDEEDELQPVRAPVKEAPVKEAPVKEAPVKEAPVKEAPVKETPIQAVPTNTKQSSQNLIIEGNTVEEPKTNQGPQINGEPEKELTSAGRAGNLVESDVEDDDVMIVGSNPGPLQVGRGHARTYSHESLPLFVGSDSESEDDNDPSNTQDVRHGLNNISHIKGSITRDQIQDIINEGIYDQQSDAESLHPASNQSVYYDDGLDDEFNGSIEVLQTSQVIKSDSDSGPTKTVKSRALVKPSSSQNNNNALFVSDSLEEDNLSIRSQESETGFEIGQSRFYRSLQKFNHQLKNRGP